MNYTFQVAYLNALRQKKIIPKNILEELKLTKNLSSLVSVLKEYKYNKIFSFTKIEEEIFDSVNFESVLEEEINDTLNLLSNLLLNEHKILIPWLKYFYSKNFENIDSIMLFFSKYFLVLKKLNSKICENIFKLTIDFENIKLFLYYTQVSTNTSAQQLYFFPYGNIKEYIFKDSFPSIETLNKYITTTFYQKINLSTQPIKENLNYYFNQYLQEFIWQSKFYYFTIEPIIAYFFEKLIETQQLKEIYYNTKINRHPNL
ncbi:MAG: V-type ATPase subunit [Endomicrobiia bacterium]